MKKFLFSLSMVAALSLAVFTTSCSDDDPAPVNPEIQTAEYTSSLNVQLASPEEIEAGIGTDLGAISEDVQITINSSSKTLGLSIKEIDLGKIPNPDPTQDHPIPAQLRESPFPIELQNVPYTETEGVYNVSYYPTINEEEMTTDVAININGDKAYLVSLEGSINEDNLQLTIYVIGDNNLLWVPVTIIVEGTKK